MRNIYNWLYKHAMWFFVVTITMSFFISGGIVIFIAILVRKALIAI